MDFRFTNEYPVSKIDEIVSYLLGPRLWIPKQDYPDFLDWADKVHEELKKDLKKAIIALSFNDVVGVLIYQKHKKEADVLEIKNLTVRPDVRGRHIASFLFRNAEIEGCREFESKYAICDAKANNFAIKNFLLKQKYSIKDKRDLYQVNSGEDLIFTKPISHLL